MYYVIIQIIGFIAFMFSLIAYHKNKKEKILGYMILSSSLNLMHYLLLGAYSGCTTKIISIIRDCFIIIRSKHKSKLLSSNLFLLIFLIIYFITGILTYNSIWSTMPIIAATIYIIFIWNGNELTVKKTAFACYFLWLTYNICVLSLSGIISNIVSIVSAFLAVRKQRINTKVI